MTTSPYFELSYSPLVEWTTTGSVNAGVSTSTTTPTLTYNQASDIDEATKRANNTVRLSVIFKFSFFYNYYF